MLTQDTVLQYKDIEGRAERVPAELIEGLD
jgi:hypothetical protein